MHYFNIFTVCILLTLFTACDSKHRAPDYASSEARPAGDASTQGFAFNDLMSPAGNIPLQDKPNFHAGKALAHQPWVKAPSITDARDGLGPLFNARSCLACHQDGGRGKLPEDESERLFGPLVRLSIPFNTDVDASSYGPVPDPTYGNQIQTSSIALSDQLRNANSREKVKSSVPAEADIYIKWHYQIFTYPDGTETEIRKPEPMIVNLGYGALHPDVQISLRNAPTIAGMGLLEAIPEATLLAAADPEDRNDDGISGRANRVWDQSQGKEALGRFGLKSNRASVLDTVAAAFAGDIGLSNPVYPHQPCTNKQVPCSAQQSGNDTDGFEIPRNLLDLTNDFIRNIGVPVRAAVELKKHFKGREHFYALQCQQCHTPSFTTEKQTAAFSHLGEQTIWPYSDLLLHDMGPELADKRPDYRASGREWRTAPLWGMSASRKRNGNLYLLHDGRARTVEEAVLWHGGEAEASKTAFSQLDTKARNQLIQFVESL